MSDRRCIDITADRRMGDYWERQFCKMAAKLGRSFTPHQIGRESSALAAYAHSSKWHTATLPDVTIWTRPGEHHEIKQKNPTQGKEFGLERYRIEALRWFAEETGQSVYYTIHNYDLVQRPTRDERKACRENDESHWLTASIMDLVSLDYRVVEKDKSWVNGRERNDIEIWYWRTELFFPLLYLWGLVERPKYAPLLQARLV